MQELTVTLVRPEEFSVSQWKVYSDLDEEHDKEIIKYVQE